MHQAHKPSLGPYSPKNPRYCLHCGVFLPDLLAINQFCVGDSDEIYNRHPVTGDLWVVDKTTGRVKSVDKGGGNMR
jgi:hypothetical protein